MLCPAQLILDAAADLSADHTENIYEEIRTPPRSPAGKVKKSTKRRRAGLTATRSADPRLGKLAIQTWPLADNFAYPPPHRFIVFHHLLQVRRCELK